MANDPPIDQVFDFGAFRFDTRMGTLARGEEQIFLRPKAHTLLLHLAQNMGRVVPKAELMDVVWPEIYVTEDSLTQCIREIRKALGDSVQQVVRTVSRRGYVLVGKSDVLPETTSQPVVAVLRFRNENGDPADESLVDGFAGDIINGLARFGTLTVLARTSSFSFASYAQPVWSSVASTIGADYVVEGSVRRSGTKALVAVNLIDASKSLQLWGQRYEASDVGIFSIQQEISEAIVTRLVSRVDEASLRRSAVKPAQNLAAYELVIHGAKLLRNLAASPKGEARMLFEQAIARDREYGLAYAYLALEAVVSGGLGRTPTAILDHAQNLVARCLSLSPEQSLGHRVMSLIRLYRREHSGAEEDLRLSLALNPCDADGVEQMGFLMITRGRAHEGLEWIAKATRLNPLHPEWYHFDRGLAHYVLGEYDQAIAVLERSHSLVAWTPTLLAACHARLGNKDAAVRSVRNIAAVDPSFDPVRETRTAVAFESALDIEHLVEGVELALGWN